MFCDDQDWNSHSSSASSATRLVVFNIFNSPNWASHIYDTNGQRPLIIIWLHVLHLWSLSLQGTHPEHTSSLTRYANADWISKHCWQDDKMSKTQTVIFIPMTSNVQLMILLSLSQLWHCTNFTYPFLSFLQSISTWELCWTNLFFWLPLKNWVNFLFH